MRWKTHKPELKPSHKKTPKNPAPILHYLDYFHHGFETVMIFPRLPVAISHTEEAPLHNQHH